MTIESERMENLEQRLGVEIARIGAWVTDQREVRVCGEVRASRGLNADVRVVVSIHAADGRVIGATAEYDCVIRTKHFRLLTVFDATVATNRPASEAVKVRVYVQPAS